MLNITNAELENVYMKVIMQAVKDYTNPGGRCTDRFEAKTWLKGEECKSLCDFFDLDHRALVKYIDEFKGREKKKIRNWDEKEEETLLKMLKEGYSIHEIAKSLRRTKGGVTNKLRYLEEKRNGKVSSVI